jgi:hypothetical protein
MLMVLPFYRAFVGVRVHAKVVIRGVAVMVQTGYFAKILS